MDFRQLLVDKLGAEKAEEEIRKEIESFNGLITREIAAKVAAKKLGVVPESEPEGVVKISELKEGVKRATLRVRLLSFGQKITHQSGKTSRSILIGDETGEESVSLWNDDLNSLNSLHIGDLLEISGVYRKLGFVNMGYGGGLKRMEGAPFFDLSSAPKDGAAFNTELSVVSSSRDSVVVSDGKTSAGFLCGSALSSKIQKGDTLLLEGVQFKDGALVRSERSRVLRKPNAPGGIVKSISVENGKAVLGFDGREEKLSRAEFLALVGLKAPDDISLETIAMLKKDAVINKYVVF